MTNPSPSAMAEPPNDPLAAAAAAADPQAATRGAAGLPAQQGWLDTVQSILGDLPGLVSDRIDLLSLELKRAGSALAQIVALLVAAAILGVTAWLALWVGIGVGLVELGLHWAWSLLLVLGLNACTAWLAIGRLRTLLPLLSLPATRRHLMPGSDAGPDAGSKSAASATSLPTPPPSPPSSGAGSPAPLGQTA